MAEARKEAIEIDESGNPLVEIQIEDVTKERVEMKRVEIRQEDVD